MKIHNSFDLTQWVGDGLGSRPANDADTTDERFRKLIRAMKYFKHMEPWKIRSQTFAERIERAEVLRRVRIFEQRYGVIL